MVPEAREASDILRKIWTQCMSPEGQTFKDQSEEEEEEEEEVWLAKQLIKTQWQLVSEFLSFLKNKTTIF